MLTKTICLCTNAPRAQPSVKAYQSARPKKRPVYLQRAAKQRGSAEQPRGIGVQGGFLLGFFLNI